MADTIRAFLGGPWTGYGSDVSTPGNLGAAAIGAAAGYGLGSGLTALGRIGKAVDAALPNCPVVAKRKLTAADFAEIAEKISQKQLRHISGRPEHIARGGGYLNTVDDAQAVLDAYRSGAAEVLGKSSQGFPIVRFEGVTGTNVNVGAGITNQPTNVFMIKGTASPSVVPVNPYWTP